MSKVRPTPCSACPYRRDVPSGVWARHEYEKLRAYDRPTADQPMATFQCHTSPEAYCHGWVLVHTLREHEFDLLALRVWSLEGLIPQAVVPLFTSGNEAADHGERDLAAPSEESKVVVSDLMRRHPRLKYESEEGV